MRELERDLRLLEDLEVARTVGAIAEVQRADGCIPWFPGGHADPWDHVEAAMALDIGGLHDEAVAAYEWLARTQGPEGAWPTRFEDGRPVDGTLDANFSSYVAVGCHHHWLATQDDAFIEAMWPTLERAMGFVLDLQLPNGAIAWARDPKGAVWPAPLLTSSSCIHLSLRSAIFVAELLGEERPEWELAADRIAEALVTRPEVFEPKDRYSMDWYYPALSGALDPAAARHRITASWERFVVTGLGCRCVSDRPWITTGETCELVLALDAVGLTDAAHEVFSWIHYLRADDGAYWTGATFPDGTVWPREKPTWCSGSVVLAADALEGTSPTSSFFRDANASDLDSISDRVGEAS